MHKKASSFFSALACFLIKLFCHCVLALWCIMHYDASANALMQMLKHTNLLHIRNEMVCYLQCCINVWMAGFIINISVNLNHWATTKSEPLAPSAGQERALHSHTLELHYITQTTLIFLSYEINIHIARY